MDYKEQLNVLEFGALESINCPLGNSIECNTPELKRLLIYRKTWPGVGYYTGRLLLSPEDMRSLNFGNMFLTTEMNLALLIEPLMKFQRQSCPCFIPAQVKVLMGARVFGTVRQVFWGISFHKVLTVYFVIPIARHRFIWKRPPSRRTHGVVWIPEQGRYTLLIFLVQQFQLSPASSQTGVGMIRWMFPFLCIHGLSAASF